MERRVMTIEKSSILKSSWRVWLFGDSTECVLKKQRLPLNCFLNFGNIPVGEEKETRAFLLRQMAL